MLVFGLAQLAGALLVLLHPVLPHPAVFLVSLPAAIAALPSRRLRWFTALWLGAALAAWQASIQLADRLSPELEGAIIEITGTVEGLVETDARRQRFLFRVHDGWLDGQPVRLPSLVRLSLYEADFKVTSGERWQWRVKLRRPRGLANPGGFDYERWLFVRGIGATGYVRAPQAAVKLDEPRFALRGKLATRIAAVVEGRSASMIRALATGDRGGMNAADWEVLRLTGTAHLMAISGLHLAMVTGLAYGVLAAWRRRFMPRSPSWWPALVTALLGCGYAALAGFALPVRRALLAVLVVLFALAARRMVSGGHVFGVALTAMLWLEPLSVLDASFWLSYGAVAAILYLALARRPHGSPLARAVRVQLGLFLLTAPLIAAFFAQVPLISPLANAVAIPVFGMVLVPGVLLITVVLPFSETLAVLLLRPVQWVFDALLECLERLAAINPEFVLAGLPWSAAACGVLAVVLACAPRALPGRWLALPLLLPVFAFNRASEIDARFAVHVLDVGQGLAVVVETANHTLVYDTGPAFGENSAAEMVIVPFLRARGRRADRIMISHRDNDHAGGLATLARHYPDAIVHGRVSDGIADCKGQAWEWDAVSFEVIHASGQGRGNDNSCVLHVSAGGRSALLTGDIEAHSENELVRLVPERLNVDVAIIPHHGSLTSSTPRFVRAAGATLAVAGAGYGNRWSFPREEVVKRWQAVGAKVLVSGEQGAISIEMGEEISVRTFREQRRIWREVAVFDADGK